MKYFLFHLKDKSRPRMNQKMPGQGRKQARLNIYTRNPAQSKNKGIILFPGMPPKRVTHVSITMLYH
jgi:hypothetical protein